MQLRKYRWSRDYESAEEELEQMFKLRRFKAERWVVEAGEQPDQRQHDFDVQLWCAEGSMSLHTEGQTFSLQPGDALDLPAGIAFTVTPGMTGVVCYESRPAPQA